MLSDDRLSQLPHLTTPLPLCNKKFIDFICQTTTTHPQLEVFHNNLNSNIWARVPLLTRLMMMMMMSTVVGRLPSPLCMIDLSHRGNFATTKSSGWDLRHGLIIRLRRETRSLARCGPADEGSCKTWLQETVGFSHF